MIKEYAKKEERLRRKMNKISLRRRKKEEAKRIKETEERMGKVRRE